MSVIHVACAWYDGILQIGDCVLERDPPHSAEDIVVMRGEIGEKLNIHHESAGIVIIAWQRLD